jgi:malate/lactate dehydrogenase
VPVSILLRGEYGIHDVVLGVPAFLGATGLLKIEELRLNATETRNLQAAAAAIRERLGL